MKYKINGLTKYLKIAITFLALAFSKLKCLLFKKTHLGKLKCDSKVICLSLLIFLSPNYKNSSITFVFHRKNSKWHYFTFSLNSNLRNIALR